MPGGLDGLPQDLVLFLAGVWPHKPLLLEKLSALKVFVYHYNKPNITNVIFFFFLILVRKEGRGKGKEKREKKY